MPALDNRLAKLRPRLNADQDVQHRIAAAGLLAIKSFMAERSKYFKSRNADSVHQMRVAIRRLRTVLYVINQVTPENKFLESNRVLQNFSRILGHGRDQDIFLGMLQQIPSSFMFDLDAQEYAVHAIISVRDKAYLQIDAALQEKYLNLEFDSLITIFQNRDIAFQPHIAARDDLDTLLLKKMHKIILKRGRGLKDNGIEERHRLRIALKRLRYALEFLALRRRDTARGRAFTKTIERLLDRLGAGNDAFTAGRIASECLSHNNPHIHLMGGMIAGWHGRAVRDNEADLIKIWQKFSSLSPYWD